MSPLPKRPKFIVYSPRELSVEKSDEATNDEATEGTSAAATSMIAAAEEGMTPFIAEQRNVQNEQVVQSNRPSQVGGSPRQIDETSMKFDCGIRLDRAIFVAESSLTRKQ